MFIIIYKKVIVKMEKFKELHENGKEAIKKAEAKGEKHAIKVKKQMAQDARDNHVTKKEKAILDICKIDAQQLGTAMQVVKAGALLLLSLLL